jgi:general secretion pathway protein C
MVTIGIRLANAILFVLSCSVAAGIITDVTASVVIPDQLAAPAPIATDAPPAMRWQDRQVILDRNLFDAQVTGEGIASEAPIDEVELEETKLPLKLLGTIASEDQRVASAAIESSATRQHEVVKVGDALTGHTDVSVERIDRGRVVLLNGPRREELLLDENVAAIVGRSPPPRDNPAANRRESRRNRQARSNVRDRIQDLADQGGPTSPAAIFSQARILPKYENGAMVGIELSKIQEDSFFQQVGLQEGDIVTSLNGIPIDSPSASAQLLGAFSSPDPIPIDVMDSSGQTRTITVDPSKVNVPGLE